MILKQVARFLEDNVKQYLICNDIIIIETMMVNWYRIFLASFDTQIALLILH